MYIFSVVCLTGASVIFAIVFPNDPLNYNWKLDWSFWVLIASAPVQLLTGLVVNLDIRYGCELDEERVSDQPLGHRRA